MDGKEELDEDGEGYDEIEFTVLVGVLLLFNFFSLSLKIVCTIVSDDIAPIKAAAT